MNIRELLQTKECEFLDFKYAMYEILSPDNNKKLLERMELIRDIFSLINIKRTDIEINESYLVIGIDETDQKYNGRHKNITFTNTQLIIQLIQEFIEPSLTIEFKDNYIAGDHNNIMLSENPVPGYDRILTFMFKREIGTVYEFKKQIGNKDVGFERVGAAYSRDESHKRRIRESDRIKIREVLNVRLILTFENNSSGFLVKKNLKKIYNDEELDEKLKRVKESLYQDLSSIPKEKLLDESEREKMSNLFSRISGTDYIYSEISEADWEEYNKKIDSYIEELKKFLKKRGEYFKESNKILSFNLELHNNGKEMATDIDLYLIIPEPCEFIEELPQFQLESQKIPKRPRSSLLRVYDPLTNMGKTMAGMTKALASNFTESFDQLLSPSIYSLGTRNSPNNYSIEDKQTLNIQSEKLKQGYFMKINKIRVKIPSIVEYDELIIQFVIITGRPSRTFNDRLILKINTH